MRQSNIIIVACMFAVVSLNLANSANVYIRSGASGDGSDWANARNNFPNSLARGNTYYVADGTYPGYDFDDDESGETYIYIKKATIEDHGTDVGWNDSYGDGQAVFNDRVRIRSDYWVFDGQVGGGPGSWKSGHGFVIDPEGSGTDCLQLDAPQTHNGTVHHITVKHVELVGSGRDVGSGMNCLEQLWGGPGTISEFVTISHCYMHDSSRSPVKTRHVAFWVFEYNWIERNRSTAAQHSEGWSNHGGRDNIVRYNVWADIEGTGIFVNLFSTATRWEFYGNIFFNTPGNPYNQGGIGNGAIATRTSEAPAHSWKVYNNTFYNLNIPDSKYGVWLGSGGDGNNETFNNLYVNCTGVAHFQTNHDYNTYYDSTLVFTPNAFEEEHAGNPLTDPGNEDFSLSNTTAPGKTLGLPFSHDMFGRVRGGDGIWDRGAIEYNVTPPFLSGIVAFDSNPNPFNITPNTRTDKRDVKVTLLGVLSNPTHVHLSEDPAINVNVTTYNYVENADYDFTLSDGDGLKTIYAQLSNEFGVSLTSSYLITLDTTPPEILSSQAISELSMQVVFTEPMGIGALDPTLYEIEGDGVGTLNPHPDVVAGIDDTYTLIWSSGQMVAGEDITVKIAQTVSSGDELTDGLVGYWPMEEGIGLTTDNTAGSNFNGALGTGVSWTDGIFGKALDFNGTNSAFVNISRGGLTQTSGTISLWAKAENFSVKKQTMFGHTTLPAFANRLQIYTESIDGQLSIGLADDPNFMTDIFDLDLDTWYMLTLTYAPDSWALFVDGVEVAAGNFSGLTGIGNAHIGNSGRNSGPTDPFDGILDDVRVYNRVLSLSEIQQLHSMATPMQVYDQVGWPLDDPKDTLLSGSGVTDPCLIGIIPQSDSTIQAVFSKPMNPLGAFNPLTYTFSGQGMGSLDPQPSPSSVTGGAGVYTLHWDTGEMTENEAINLTVNSLLDDEQGNQLPGGSCLTAAGVGVGNPPELVSVKRAPGFSVLLDHDTITAQFIAKFDEEVAGVEAEDFLTITSDQIIDSYVSEVQFLGDACWLITVNTGIGEGTLTIQLKPNHEIIDLNGNNLGPIDINPEFFVIADLSDLTSAIHWELY